MKKNNLLGVISFILIIVSILGAGIYFIYSYNKVYTEDKINSETVKVLQNEWNENNITKKEIEPEAEDNNIPVAERVKTYENFGILYIPSLPDYERLITAGDESIIISGGDNNIDYYPQGQMPGEVGNFSLAGHIGWGVGSFNDINKLKTGDKVIVQTKEGYYKYSVSYSEIVPETQGEVLLPVPNKPNATPNKHILTMTTCFFDGIVKKRLVVYADFEGFSKIKPE